MPENRNLYLMIVNKERRWMSITEAGKAYSAGFWPVSIGGKVVNENGKERDITPEEKKRISDIADRHSEEK